ncbi:HEAT repeat domain-containing protein [Methanosarcina mazei]|uniref:HEAT repeat domain-containing protein n=1 Tax=Methanosarcina mazei TaxID=2209 RepID=A0A0F8NAT9_METMZ|nr:HEAT repeat domain-containing protein [Methanosarcina mazei]KKG34724.1 hypothetical protein DU52_17145 [Methanosarcina mazei]KKG86723.1 hypothetical protein DU57_10200 [Methanosarcina mazei]KKG90073.1 hypothetical protein DU59_04010 [Methanosarcina mazei]KKH14921.1 hypothetical protein DU42_02840 [Methanosarcina mazei]KKH19345.1 hypothetical protein DU65_05440 [Methanosarcina mazei]
MIDQERIHAQCLSEDPDERIKALKQFEIKFSSLSDKQQAWNDLHRLTNDEIGYVREEAVYVLSSVFSDIPDKQKAYSDLIKLISDQYNEVGYKAVDALCSVFSHVPDKQQAWNDLHRLTTNENYSLRYWTANIIGSLFSQSQDKQHAWEDLHRLADDKENLVRVGVIFAIDSAYSHIQDKQQAWEDLHRLTNDPYPDIRWFAADAIGSLFSQLSDKQQAWDDLHKLTNDQSSDVRHHAICSIGSAFPNLPDKEQAWSDLHKLTIDEDNWPRSGAASGISFSFSQLPDKEQAWKDLHKLINDTNYNVRGDAAKAIASIFFQIPDKQQAWKDLHKLTYDDSEYCEYIKFDIASALGVAFPNLPDKQQAWNDLYRLSVDEFCEARQKAIEVLGSAFIQVPNKDKALNDLYELTRHPEDDIRAYANYSLGKIHIFKASRAENEGDYKRELENAIAFFEKAGQTNWYENPAQFCLPFYRSFHTIIFKKQEAKEEVDKYLVEAKHAIQNSKSKQLLFEAVESLAEALKEVLGLENMSLETKKEEINSYIKYFNHAEELMKNNEERVPFAIGTIRKGLPILDRNLKKLIEEIQEKAKSKYRQSKGTATEEIAYLVCREVQKWEVGNQERMTQNIEDLILILKAKVPNNDENKSLLDKIEKIREEKNLTTQYESIKTIVGSLPIIQVVPKNNGLIDSINAPATIAAFGGFLILETLNIIYPSGNFSHLTSLYFAIAIFSITFIIQRKRNN